MTKEESSSDEMNRNFKPAKGVLSRVVRGHVNAMTDSLEILFCLFAKTESERKEEPFLESFFINFSISFLPQPGTRVVRGEGHRQAGFQLRPWSIKELFLDGLLACSRNCPSFPSSE